MVWNDIADYNLSPITVLNFPEYYMYETHFSPKNCFKLTSFLSLSKRVTSSLVRAFRKSKFSAKQRDGNACIKLYTYNSKENDKNLNKKENILHLQTWDNTYIMSNDWVSITARRTFTRVDSRWYYFPTITWNVISKKNKIFLIACIILFWSTTLAGVSMISQFKGEFLFISTIQEQNRIELNGPKLYFPDQTGFFKDHSFEHFDQLESYLQGV